MRPGLRELLKVLFLPKRFAHFCTCQRPMPDRALARARWCEHSQSSWDSDGGLSSASRLVGVPAVASNSHLRLLCLFRTCSLETCCSGAPRTKLGRHSGKTLHLCRSMFFCLATMPCLYEHSHTHTHLGIHLAATNPLVIKHCLMYHESMKLSGVPVPVWPQGFVV